MGFYGNITNTARTQFQFDKVYPNRYEMEQKTKTDGIYAGRYILIEYDSDVHLDHMKRVWYKANGWHSQDDNDISTLLKKGDVVVGELVYTVSADVDRVDPRDYKDCIFYVCKGFASPSEAAVFEEVVDGAESPAYTVNYNMDTDVFGAGRGYDSTVWQKTYSAEAGEKYVMIAELNTVVPTFDVTPDAPTMNPVVPHFDTQSTDVYYKLHWQAPWGFRVKEAKDEEQNPLPSDEITTHTITTYDPETGVNTTTETPDISAAIYYNHAAFDPQVDANRTSVDGINKYADAEVIDEIKVEPTGKSGNKYNDHEGQSTQSEQVDIQEMTINLPSIGNMMSDAWDIIHGPRRNNDMRETDPVTGEYVASLKGRLDSIDAIDENQIPIKRIDNGQLVGTKINGDVRDTTEDNTDEILEVELSSSYESDDAWIETKVDADNTPNAIAIHHTFHKKPNSASESDLNVENMYRTDVYYNADHLATNNLHTEEANKDVLNLYVPYVDAAGHVVGHNIETVTLPYSYRFFTTEAVTDVDDADLYTTIKPDTDGDNTSEVTAAASDLTADQTQDTLAINPGNKWVQLKLDDSSDTLTIAHEIHAVDEVAQNSNLNTDNVESALASDKLTIQDIEFDAAGHVTMNRLHTYTLPYGFKTITTNGRSAEVSENATGEPETANVVADTTQDTLAINSGNKWIRIDTDATGDSVTIRHDVHETSDTTSTKTLVSETGVTTFDVPTYAFDKAGHYISHDTKTITVPFGYGKIKGDNNTSTTASATYDEVTFASDEWLTATVTKDTVTYSHDYPKKIDDTTSESDVNGNGDTIVLETLERDDKGHVIKVNENTVTLPFGYKTFIGDSGSTSADNTQDTMNIKGDDWVDVAVSADVIKLTHKAAVAGTSAASTSPAPNFGGQFTFKTYDFDDKGHKFASTDHTVTIPTPSLTKAETGNVVTNLTLTPATGALIETKTNLGDITLGSFTAGDVSSDIESTNTLATALSRLQRKIVVESENRNTAITNAINALDVTDAAVAGQYVSAVNEVDGKIEVIRADLPVYATTEQGAKADSALQLDTQITYNDTTNTVEALLNMIIDLQARVTALEAQLNPSEDNSQPTE